MDTRLIGQIPGHMAFDKEQAGQSYPPHMLAFLGDAVFGLYIRTYVAAGGEKASGRLHELSAELVRASSQAVMIRGIMGELSPEERAVYKKGRNANTTSHAKHATMSEYHQATGLEALFGYLYLEGEEERMSFLVGRCIEAYKSHEAGETKNE